MKFSLELPTGMDLILDNSFNIKKSLLPEDFKPYLLKLLTNPLWNPFLEESAESLNVKNIFSNENNVSSKTAVLIINTCDNKNFSVKAPLIWDFSIHKNLSSNKEGSIIFTMNHGSFATCTDGSKATVFVIHTNDNGYSDSENVLLFYIHQFLLKQILDKTILGKYTELSKITLSNLGYLSNWVENGKFKESIVPNDSRTILNKMLEQPLDDIFLYKKEQFLDRLSNNGFIKNTSNIISNNSIIISNTIKNTDFTAEAPVIWNFSQTGKLIPKTDDSIIFTYNINEFYHARVESKNLKIPFVIITTDEYLLTKSCDKILYVHPNVILKLL